MELSIIIPVYNAATFIAPNVRLLEAFLKTLPYTYEMVLVNDGSTDTTKQEIELLCSETVRLVDLAVNQGKFGALIKGIAESRGECKIFTDADLPYELEAIPYIASLILKRRFHIVIGDRTLLDSDYSRHLSRARKIATGGFSAIVRMLVTGGLFDTQCGLKGFRADVADALFPLIHDRGFCGDVELLYIALKYNLEVKRIPVRLKRSERSTVGILGDGLQMTRRLASLRWHWNTGSYRSAKLQEISKQQYWD